MKPHEKLAESLAILKALQDDGRRVFQSKELTRTHRERLLSNGFLREIIKGWLMSSSPTSQEGDSTPWYASFWEFCSRYAASRFGQNWHLSPEQSLLLHAQAGTIPAQALIYTPKGTGNSLSLPFQSSLYDLKTPRMPPAEDLIMQDGLRLYRPAAALARIPDGFFTRSPVEAQIALSAIKDSSELLGHLLDEGRTTIAGRLAGALRRVGKAGIADDIVSTMKRAGYDVRETDPFSQHQKMAALGDHFSPVVTRIKTLWATYRDDVLTLAPPEPGLPTDKQAFLKALDDIYKSDAYHSLSIEGYSVSLELIEQVRSGNWDPDTIEADRKTRDALAARGYWQAFQQVKASVAAILEGADPGQTVKTGIRRWYAELFQPSVTAGLLKPGALAGYRSIPIYLRGSRHVPPRWESLPDAMSTLLDLIAEEPNAFVRAVLGHWMTGYIHPFPDGNGRTARFLMNTMLASGGFNWLVIRVDERAQYLATLEDASVGGDIRPFASFIRNNLPINIYSGNGSLHGHKP